jgi:hypothetical protein
MRTKRIAVFLCVLVCSVGMAVAQTEWTDHPDNPVIGVDDPGPWAPGGAWVSSVLYDGAIYHMWFEGMTVLPSGWITGVAVGHATSTDGVEWSMDPANPVIPAGDPGEWDDEAAGGGPVIFDGTQFKMWYAGWSEDSSNVGYATSTDGSTWTKYSGNPVMDRGSPGSWDDKWIQPATVLVEDGTYRMWFHGRTEDYYTGLIGYAESPDGISWTKRPEPVLAPAEYPGSVEASFLYPSVVNDGTTYHMWHANDAPESYVDIHYAYSGDGIEWTKHRGNPVHEMADESVFTVSALLDGDTWRMWTSHFGGARDSRVSYATSDCCAGEAAVDTWLFIAGTAVASGAQGAFFQTDVDVSNADDRAIEYRFQWLPRGEDNTEPVTSDVFTLDAGNCVRYSNVLAEIFDLEPDSFGTLVIQSSSPDLLAMSRTYNLGTEKTGGTYGQAMAAIPPAEFIGQNEVRRILFGTENADMRTNVGCQNGGLDTVAVFMELFDSQGTSLGRPFVMLQPLGNDQVNRIFDGHNPVNGYIEISSPSPNASYYCYGSVLDNVTSDPTTIPPQ